MKKTLLCFLLLLPTLIFSQVSSIIHCAGDNVFDLTSRYDELTKGLTPDQNITVKYYMKDTYAIYDEYAIENPKNFVFNERQLQIHVNVYTNGQKQYTKSFMIILNHAIEFASASVSYPQCGNNRVYIAARYGKDPIQYSLDRVNFQTSSSFYNVAPGTYNIRIKDDYGCTKDTTLVVPTIYPLTATTLKVDNSCSGVNDGRIEVTAFGGMPTYTYSKNGGSFQPSNIFSNLAAGHYDITVKDGVGCLYTLPIDIAQPTILSAFTTATTVKTPNGNDGEITVIASGGTPNYSYRLNNLSGMITPFQSSNIFKNLTAGNYIVEVIDARGCFFTSPINVNASISPLTISATVSEATCIDASNSVIINATGGSGSNLYSIDGSSYTFSNIFSNLNPGIYTLWVKDSQNSVANITAVINPFNSLTATVNATKIENCSINYSSTITIDASGGKLPYQYAINGTDYQKNNTFVGAAPGIHVVKVKDDNQCVFTTTLVIESPVSLTASATVDEAGICGDKDKVTINAAGGQTPYSYSFNQGSTYSDINSRELTAGNYTLFVKDAANCIVTTNITVLPSTGPNIILSSITDITSPDNNDASITITTTGGTLPYSYSLNRSNAAVVSSQSVYTFSNLSPGTYDIIVKDAKGCISQSVFVIIEAPSSIPLLATADISLPDCSNPSRVITVTASGGSGIYQYSFDNGNTYTYSNTYVTTSPGTYLVSVRDSQNKVYTLTLKLTPPIPMQLNATIVSPVTCTTNGIIMAHAISGQSSITYSINGSSFQPTNIFENLGPGNYIIAAKDNNGCMETLVITLDGPIAINASVNVENQAITVNATGGTGDYRYSIDSVNFQDENVFQNVPKGTYVVTVKDSSGCTVSKSGVIVNTIQPLDLIVTAIPADCLNGGTINALATGGIEPYLYSFNNGQTFTDANVLNNIPPGNYQIFVKDSKNNTASNIIVISEPSFPIVSADVQNVRCKGDLTGSIKVMTSGTSQLPYFYSLNGGVFQSNDTFFNLSTGVHIITVKDSKGCLTSLTVNITEPSEPLSSLVTVKNQTITVNAHGGTGNIRYAISPNLDQLTTNNIFSDLTPGYYQVIVQDENGCFVIQNVLIEAHAPAIDGKKEIVYEFKQGQTLGDLVIDGQNIKWYSTPGTSATGKTSKAAETTLPYSTILVDGVTYYASQTINGTESKERLAVTAKVNGSLSTPDFEMADFRFYPNPVQHILSIQYKSIIEHIQIFSVSGQSVFFKKINNTHSEIDLSNLSKGLYILNVKADGKEKAVKFIKE